MRNEIEYTMKNWEMILYTERRIEKWYCIHNQDLRNDIEYTMGNLEMVLNTQWRFEKSYCIHNEE